MDHCTLNFMGGLALKKKKTCCYVCGLSVSVMKFSEFIYHTYLKVSVSFKHNAGLVCHHLGLLQYFHYVQSCVHFVFSKLIHNS